MFNFKSIALTVSITGLSLGVANAGNASALSIFSDRAAFQTQLVSSITDGYDAVGYQTGDKSNNQIFDLFTNAGMSGVLGETKYQTTGFSDQNVIDQRVNPSYCAGCNGSFLLDFTQTSVGSGSGVFGVGLDVLFNDASLPYSAFVTFGDGVTQNFALLPTPQFFGITSDTLIRSIAFGLPNGGTTQGGRFAIDNLTIGSATPIPTPALLPGLLGMGIAAWKKRKNEESEQVAETAEV